MRAEEQTYWAFKPEQAGSSGPGELSILYPLYPYLFFSLRCRHARDKRGSPLESTTTYPACKVPLHSGETAEALRPAHHFVALPTAPQAGRCLGRGPFLGLPAPRGVHLLIALVPGSLRGWPRVTSTWCRCCLQSLCANLGVLLYC